MSKKSLLNLLPLLVSFLMSTAQPALKTVPGLPTKELYDLYIDKKGYLWIAHDLGISRFDGLNYIHFSNGEQASLSTTGIIEDNEGRIWCHNFSGQIFYIENGQMKLLKSYDYTRESQFPQIAICGNELLVTSDHGLFICTTTNLKARYVPLTTSKKGRLISLSVVDKRAVLFDSKGWYVYGHGTGIKKIAADTAINSYMPKSAMLQQGSFGNLLFLILNTKGIVQKLLFNGDSLKLLSNYKRDDFINTVSVNEQTWIHTRNESKTLDGKWVITGQSLTDAVIDKAGNTWFSSLKKGLLVSYKKAQWEVITPLVDNGDFIRCFNVMDGYFFAGTNKGNLLVFDFAFKKINWQVRLFDGFGSIEFIRFYKDHQFVVGGSVHTYIVNPVEEKIEKLISPSSVKDVDFDENSLYLAAANGAYMMPYLDSISLSAWQQSKKQQFPFIPEISVVGNSYLFAQGRARAIRYDKKAGALYVSLKNGLHEINSTGIHPFNIDGKAVFASSLLYRAPRLFIGTFSDGLWIKNGSRLRHLTTSDLLSSNTILRTKATLNHLWLFQNETIQVLDMNSEKLINNLELPKVNGANVFDVAEWNGFGFLATEEGIYKIRMNNVGEDLAPTGFLDAVIVNNKDTLPQGSTPTLTHKNNDLQFIVSSPSFYDPAATSFRYRMLGVNEAWQNTKPGERIIRYVSLPPGHYTFQAFPTNTKGLTGKQKIEFEVDINKPWWNQWWFYTLLFVTLVALIYVFEQNRVQQLMKVEKVRRNISSDLHDDIGATLSSINIYTELAKKEKNNIAYLDAIQRHSHEVTGKLDDLIWSINPRNDSFEKLISRMHSYAAPELQARGIGCAFKYNDIVLKEKLQVGLKQNLYLILKELVNNVVKHSHARHCFIHLDFRSNLIVLSVKDDGRGYDVFKKMERGNGIQNVKERVDRIRGDLEIESTPGNGTTVIVYKPLQHKYVSFYKKWMR